MNQPYIEPLNFGGSYKLSIRKNKEQLRQSDHQLPKKKVHIHSGRKLKGQSML